MTRGGVFMVVKVGIFWFANGKLISDFKEVEYSEGGQYVNYPYSHFDMWDKLKPYGEKGDFATYPRGRVLYDSFGKEMKIFIDKCITKKQVRELATFVKLDAYVWKIYYDQHYSCDNCIDLEEI